MTEKIQHTSARLQQKMNTRYGDGLHHKHDKRHQNYPHQGRSHPVMPSINFENDESLVGSTGLLRKFNLKHLRKRSNNKKVH